MGAEAMRCAIRHLVFWAIILTCVPSWAQERYRSGSIVRPRGELAIRETTPGFFQGLGKEIGKTDPNTDYMVLDQKVVPNITGREEWIKVQPIILQPSDKNSSNSSEEASVKEKPIGWVYAGPLAKESGNFTTIYKEASGHSK
jgi:hypothetical protein